jgi:hypothetical protein
MSGLEVVVCRSFLQRGRPVLAHHVVATIWPMSAAGRTGHDRRDWIGRNSSAVANRVLGCWKSGAGNRSSSFFHGSVTELQQTPMAGRAKNGAISKQEEIENEKICIIAGVSVGVGGECVVARRSLPSSSSFRFRETRCWRLRWIGLHRRFFRHPGRRVQPGLFRSFDNKVRKAR